MPPVANQRSTAAKKAALHLLTTTGYIWTTVGFFHRLWILAVYSQFILNSILLAKSGPKLTTMTRVTVTSSLQYKKQDKHQYLQVPIEKDTKKQPVLAKAVQLIRYPQVSESWVRAASKTNFCAWLLGLLLPRRSFCGETFKILN